MTIASIGGGVSIPTAVVGYVQPPKETGISSSGFHRTVLTFTDLPIVTNGGATNTIQYGGVKIADFPVGVIRLAVSILDTTIRMDNSMSAYFVDATPEGDVSVGDSLVDSAAALGSSDLSDDSIVGATAFTMAAFAVATSVRGVSDAVASAETFLNGSTTPVAAYINAVIDANEQTGAAQAVTLLLSGRLEMQWFRAGNYNVE